MWGSRRPRGITERLAATVTRRPGVGPQPRDERKTQRPVFCHVRDPWAGSASASWLCHHGHPVGIPVTKLHSTINIHAQVHVELGNLSKVSGVYSCQCPDHDAAYQLCRTVTLGKTECRV